MYQYPIDPATTGRTVPATMRPKTFSAPGFELRQVRSAPTVLRRRRSLTAAVSLSVGIHLLAVLLIVVLTRTLPHGPMPRDQSTVELLMVEQKGTETNQPTDRSGSKPNPIVPMTADAPLGATTPAPKLALTPPVFEDGEPSSPPQSEQALPELSKTDAHSTLQQSEEPPTKPGSRDAPVFNLEGTESESNAIALGSQILPAMPDNRFRNRPPAYPAEAEVRGQHGAVVVLIHVSETGIATGADVMESSGVEILDQAAIAAVRKWHFHPAMKAGSPVPSDMPFRFIFDRY